VREAQEWQPIAPTDETFTKLAVNECRKSSRQLCPGAFTDLVAAMRPTSGPVLDVRLESGGIRLRSGDVPIYLRSSENCRFSCITWCPDRSRTCAHGFGGQSLIH